MKQNTILIAIVALLVGGIGAYLVVGNDADDYNLAGMMSDRTDQTESGDMAGMHMMADGTMMGNDMPMGNMDGMDHSMMMVNSEREFVTGMIPHHQEAVDTANEVIARGGSTLEIKALAENIVIAQEKEIAEMKQWYQDWYGVAYEEKAEDYQPMMRELAGLSGAELDKRFLEDMIMHHMGAIMMARSVQPYIEHEEITALTKAIEETQTTEIKLMRDLLKRL
jgi:uncharacterized protein (DUF305 family)